jgi:hypothetical protein
VVSLGQSAKKKKPRKAKPAETEPKEQFSEIEVDTSRSKNSPVAIGHDIIQNIEAPQKPIDVHPYNSDDLGVIRIGRWLMLRLYGTLDHSLSRFTLFTLIASIISGGAIYTPYVPSTPVPIGSHYYLGLSLAGFIGLALSLYFGWAPIGMAKETECPNCHYKFSFLSVQKTLTNTASLSDEEVRNFKVKKVCQNCGFTKVFKKVEHHPYPSNDGDA